MTAVTRPGIVYGSAPETMALTVLGPRTPALAGDPIESVHVLYRNAGGRGGVWECTPGRFDSARNGDTELMHFVAGDGTITSADGTVHEIRPGVVLVAPDGWRGTWEIRETVRKVYAIWDAPSSSPSSTATGD